MSAATESADTTTPAAPARGVRGLGLTRNPVLRRELLERWRGRRAFAVVTAYVVVLSAVMLLLYWVGERILSEQLRWGGFAGFGAGPTIGRFLFENVLAFVLLLVLFITPGYAAAQIAGERERRTLSLLQVTLVRPLDIVLGKLGASVAWLLLLVVAALPLGAAAFFLGGVSAPDLLRGLLLIIVVAVAVAGIGLGISAMVRKTTAAVVLTYAVVLALLLGTIFAAVLTAAIQRFDFEADERPVVLLANPFYGLADAARANVSFSGDQLPSVLSAFAAVLPQPQFRGVMIEEPMMGGGFVAGEPMPVPGQDGAERQSVWLRTIGVYTVLGLGGLAIATSKVRVGRGPRRRRRKEDEQIIDTRPDAESVDAVIAAQAGAPVMHVPPPDVADLPPPTAPPREED